MTIIIEDVRVHVLEARLREPFAYSQAWYDTRTALLVEVVAEGLSGWGECYGPARPNAAVIEAFRASLVGADAFATERVWQDLYNRFRDHGQAGLVIQALSGVDIAL